MSSYSYLVFKIVNETVNPIEVEEVYLNDKINQTIKFNLCEDFCIIHLHNSFLDDISSI